MPATSFARRTPASPGDPVLIAGCRTPIGTAGHGLAQVTVGELAAGVLADLARRCEPMGLPVREVILGNCLGPGGNIARSAALAAGLGVDIPAVTVDRQCGSGLEAIRLADALVRAAAAGSSGVPAPAPLILAGGAESASTAPWRWWPPVGEQAPIRYTRAPFAPAGFPDPEMGPAADALAAARGISRERQDAHALASHQRALAAIHAGAFDSEIVEIWGLRRDDRPRAITEERLAALRPAFGSDEESASGRPGPTVTAGNASGISDGAAAVAITTAAAAQAAGVPAWRIVASAVTAGDPAFPGAGAGPAALAALRLAGLSAAMIDVIEVVEAFSAVALAFADELGIDAGRLCRQGGSVALGHPWGASGAVAVVRLLAQMRADPTARLGLAACAIGGGQGVAVIVEACAGNDDLTRGAAEAVSRK